ncbi:restriction endonuclease subunit S [Enterococcus faecium]|uniref:restriction endonuclease subunit S n=1 Tax=Enterococcus faecium TaxID=1352 RepID=UPI000F4DE3CF|nr:restriction endonuclease subunit S [Enterococcus faecium]MDQ8262179.1 restriction endonuclease subunit S [Enterococcus faecium]ROX42418.1 restriction endonuclease subunit S [Enterococcus faecium]
MSNNTQPEIRFPGFTDDWEQRKLRDITERVHGNDGRMDLPTLTISASSGWLDQRDRFSGNIAGKEQKNYTLLKKGQLSYNHGNSKLAKYGVVFELTTYDEALVPRVYHSFDTNELASSNFIEYMFATKRPDRELSKLVSSGARMDGLLNINFDEFMGINVSVPSVEEQQKIGTFFKQLDNTIALHQRKLDLLKETKKGFLQKMFPKNGAKVPEIRFPGFTEDWEERKWYDTVNMSTDMVDPKEGEYDDLPHIGPGNIESFTGRILNNVNTVREDNLISGKFHFNSGDIIYGKINPQLAKYAYVNFEGLTSADTYVLKSHNGIIQDFLFVILQTKDFYKYSVSVSMRTGMPKINRDELNQYNYLSPSNIDEQRKIGSFFNQLDNTITLHQRKLDLLKETKKGFLQKMFV